MNKASVIAGRDTATVKYGHYKTGRKRPVGLRISQGLGRLCNRIELGVRLRSFAIDRSRRGPRPPIGGPQFSNTALDTELFFWAASTMDDEA